MKYKHRGVSICRKTFLFLHDVGKDRLQALKQHYISRDGLETRVHGNTKRAPKHAFPYSTKKHVVKFLQNYAEENSLLLPGRIPGYKRDDIKLLPSNRSKRVCIHVLQKNFGNNVTVEGSHIRWVITQTCIFSNLVEICKLTGISKNFSDFQ